jgi:hypothetical protein
MLDTPTLVAFGDKEGEASGTLDCFSVARA